MLNVRGSHWIRAGVTGLSTPNKISGRMSLVQVRMGTVHCIMQNGSARVTPDFNISIHPSIPPKNLYWSNQEENRLFHGNNPKKCGFRPLHFHR